MSMETPNYAKYNMGSIWVQELCCKAEEVNENRLHAILDKIHQANDDIRIMTSLMNKLTHAKKNNQGADFSDDNETIQWIEHIYERTPSIFDSRIPNANGKIPVNAVSNREARHIYQNNDAIEPVIKALDAELKVLGNELSEQLYMVQSRTDSNSKVIESSQKGLDEATQHVKDILRNQKGN